MKSGDLVKFKFHGMNTKENTEVELEPGNLITYMKVDGSRSTGILLGWELDVFKSPTFTVLRENGVVRTINKNMIYWCEVLA